MTLVHPDMESKNLPKTDSRGLITDSSTPSFAGGWEVICSVGKVVPCLDAIPAWLIGSPAAQLGPHRHAGKRQQRS
jgi:hypothetical protein